MRVFYELNIEDMRRLIAEKYDIDSSKIEFQGHGEYVFARVDMSDTETPGKDIESKIEISEIPVPVPEPIEPEFEDPAPKRKRASFKPSGYKFRTDVVSYDQITDTDIVDMIGSGVTVAEVCSVYGFDQQIKYRLYKRFEKARLELASSTKR